MGRRSRGIRSKSRHVMRKRAREPSLPPITKSLQQFADHDRVAIAIDPSIHKGMPHRKFQGLTGEVIGKQGEAYLLKIRNGGKEKKILIRPEHLKSMG
jgi:large subunit ribosomal protein L21e